MNTITVEKRANDYMAYINGDKRYWSDGKTPNEAIGNLIQTWPEKLWI